MTKIYVIILVMKNKKAYMKEYRLRNLWRWKRTPQQQKKVNKARRLKYKENIKYREKIKAQVRKFWRKNPEKKKNQRLKQYKITLERFKEILLLQKSKCPICGYSDMMNPYIFPMVDHCHKTKKVRGLLCLNCNHGIGKFKDSIHLLKKAIEYLRING